MATLIELTDDALRILAAVDQLGDLNLPLEDQALAEAGLTDSLNAVFEQWATKADQYAALDAEFRAEIDKWRAEEERCARRRRVAACAQQRLRERLCVCMTELDIDEITGERFKVRRQRNGVPSTRLLISEEEAVQRGYGTMVPKVETKRIVEEWKADPESIADVAVVTVGYHVRIR